MSLGWLNWTLVLAGISLLSACEKKNEDGDASPDAGRDAGADVDASADSGADGNPDVGDAEDASADASLDVDGELEGDAAADAELECGADAEVDADEEWIFDTSGPLPSSTLEEWDRQGEIFCGCFWEGGGYSSADECITETATTEFEEGCYSVAYEAHSSELEEMVRCELGVTRALNDCYESADCVQASLRACDSRAAHAIEPCAAELATQYAFYGDLGNCYIGDLSGCPDDATESSGVGTGVFAGFTGGAGDDLTGSCGSSSSPDRAHQWTAPADGTYAIDTFGSSFDTVLYVLAECAGIELACSDDDLRRQSRVEVDLTTGESVVIVVDGVDPYAFGHYAINIAEL